jgi:hypothetical protein
MFAVATIFLGSGTEKYIAIIFLGTEEYKSTEECVLFSCSAVPYVCPDSPLSLLTQYLMDLAMNSSLAHILQRA